MSSHLNVPCRTVVLGLWWCAAGSVNAQSPFDFADPVEYVFDFTMYPTSVSAGDLNDDGFVDLVVSGRDVGGRVLIMLGEGNGVFGSPMELFVDSQTEWVSVCNLDLDGPLDLVVAMRGGEGIVATFKGVGDGTFTDRVDYAVGRSPTSFAAKDLDGNGAIDLAVVNNDSDEVSILLNNGLGELNLSQSISLSGPLEGPASPFFMTTGDFDNDLDIDLVVGHLAGSHISYIRNEGDGTFSSALTLHRDVGGRVLIMLGEGNGVFGSPMELFVDSQTEWVSVCNLDLDGPLDLVVAMRGGEGIVATFKGVGDGTFTDRVDYAVGRSPTSFAAKDLDGNGAIDLAVVNNDSDEVSILLNNGLGELNLSQSISLSGPLEGPASPFFMTTGDFDNDLDIDLVVGHLAGSHISYIRNEGDGTFSSALTLPAMQPVGMAAADMNLDGITDLVMADLTDFQGQLVVVENQGDAQFSGSTVFDTGGWSWFVVTPDLDGDGRPDVVLTDVLNNLLIMFQNLSKGEIALGPEQVMATAGFPRFVLPIDLDSDCDLDLVVASIDAHRVTVLINETPQGISCLIADLSSDGRVGAADMVILLTNWDAPGGPADFDYDGHVDAADLLFLLSHWN